MGSVVLRDVLFGLSEYEDEVCVFIPSGTPEHEVGLETPVRLDDGMAARGGYLSDGSRYFLDVGVIREIARQLELQGGASPDLLTLAKACAHYAKTDTPWSPSG